MCNAEDWVHKIPHNHGTVITRLDTKIPLKCHVPRLPCKKCISQGLGVMMKDLTLNVFHHTICLVDDHGGSKSWGHLDLTIADNPTFESQQGWNLCHNHSMEHCFHVMGRYFGATHHM